MRIVIFGASGRTGRHLVRQALERGYFVTAFVRNPAKMDLSHENLSIFQGDVLHPVEVDAAVKGQDAVLSALGLTKGSPKTICADGIRNIIAAMKKHGVRRLIDGKKVISKHLSNGEVQEILEKLALRKNHEKGILAYKKRIAYLEKILQAGNKRQRKISLKNKAIFPVEVQEILRMQLKA